MTELSPPDAAQDVGHCLICYNTLDFKTLFPCNHNEICPVCVLRIRHLHNDKKCPICKQETEQVICEESTKQQHDTFEEYPIWGDELGDEFVYREGVGMFFRTEYFNSEIQPLLGFRCLECNDFDGATAAAETNGKKTAQRCLQDHLRTKHRLQLCQLCVDHQRDFVSQLPLFTPNQIQTHLKQGDKGSAFKGHPICEFCRPKRFYDMTQLHMHLNQEHYKCHVCDKAGIPNQFFKNYKSLERHFDNKHFLCHHVQCLQARFVVFESELDLRHHERQVHGTSTGSSKISLEFQYGGRSSSSGVGPQEVPSASDFDYSLDGQAFVPDDLPQSSGFTDSAESNEMADPSSLHPLHLQRTAQLRQQAARVAEEQGLTPTQPEAFPSLAAAEADADASAPALRAGWSNGSTLSRVSARPKAAVGKVTQESFPALGGGSNAASSSTGQLKKTARSGRGQNSTLAAITQAANPTPAQSWGGSQRANISAGPTSSVAAPSQSKKAFPMARASAPNVKSSEQFPSLGGNASGVRAPQPYAAANALARQPPAASQQPYAAANAFARQQKQSAKTQQTAKAKAPDWNNASHFPPPPQSNNSSSVRNRMLGNNDNAPTAAASANVLQAPSTSANKNADPKSTVEDLKTTLGKQKYKELKLLTGEFASDSLEGDAYVDMVAALFEHGYGDADFWNSVPSLIESCPASPSERAKALTYMDHLKRMKNGAMNAESSGGASSLSKPSKSTATSSWSSQPSIPSAPPPSSSSGMRAPAANKKPPPKTNYILPKKKGAWGANGSGASSSMVAKARPGSVAVAAANSQKPQQKTGTKFMAQEQKKAAAAKNGGGKKKKGKQNNELKQLAFGI